MPGATDWRPWPGVFRSPLELLRRFPARGCGQQKGNHLSSKPRPRARSETNLATTHFGVEGIPWEPKVARGEQPWAIFHNAVGVERAQMRVDVRGSLAALQAAGFILPKHRTNSPVLCAEGLSAQVGGSPCHARAKNHASCLEPRNNHAEVSLCAFGAGRPANDNACGAVP